MISITLKAFTTAIPGFLGKIVVSISVITFAFSTILAWEYYGEKCFEFIFGVDYIKYYRITWVVFVFIGAVVKLDLVWNFADAMNALMAIPNLLGLLWLGGVLSQETKTFEKGIQTGKINKYH